MDSNIFYQLWRGYRMLCDVDLITYKVTRETNKISVIGGPPVYNLGKSSASGIFQLNDLSLLNQIDEGTFELVFFTGKIMKSMIEIIEVQTSGSLITCDFIGTGLINTPTELRYLLEITKKQHNE